MSTTLLRGLSDWSHPCTREKPSAVAPFVVVVFLCFPYSWIPKVDFLALQFKPFLTLHEAEAHAERGTHSEEVKERARSWTAFVSSTLALVQSAAWIVVSTYLFIIGRSPLYSCLLALSWLYATFYPFMTLKATISYRLFMFYLVEFFGSLLIVGGAFLDNHNSEQSFFLDSFISAHFMNLIISSSLILFYFSRPLTWPSDDANSLTSPEDTTTLWRWMSFSWVTPFIRKGASKNLNEDDVWRLSPTMAARPLFMKFSEAKGGSLLRRLWAVVSRDLIFDFIFNLASVFLKYLQPFFIKRIIDSFSLQNSEDRNRAFAYACLMFVAQVIKSETDVQHSWCSRHAEAQVRTVLMSVIYDKALKRKDISGRVSKRRDGEGSKVKKDDTGADVGKIVNLMSGDASRVAQIASGMYFIYGCPIDVVIAGIFLYRLLGFSAFAGLLVLLLGWPLNSALSRRAINISRESLAARDRRMSILNELLSSIKFIKFFAWEDRWIARVFAARQKELDWLIKSRMNSILYETVWTATPVLISIVAFFAFIMQGNELTVGTAFTALMLFSMIRPPLNIIPTFIVQILQTRVALHRIESFLAEDEVDEQVSSLKRTHLNVPVSSPAEFGLKMASFKWSSAEADERNGRKDMIRKEAEASELYAGRAISSGSNVEVISAEQADRKFQLTDLSVIFPEGQLSIVTGSTASGKTALLLALLGEMTLISGQILVYKQPEKVDEHGLMDSISYAAQTPWLQHRSIKENILFGSPFDEGRYNAVVECCALLPDLEILEDGDETEIGARGVTLSGGQKARVALARAAYARTKYVLLDDPLSAVDSHTARFLYERLFLGPLMKHRTIILVTHHVDLVLPAASYLVRMSDGCIEYQGTVDNLRERKLLGSSTSTIDAQGESTQKAFEQESPMTVITSGDDGIDTELDRMAKKPKKLVLDEHREVGDVKWSIYKTYLKATSYRIWVVLFMFIICAQFLGFAEKYWIKVWAGAYVNSLTPATLDISSRTNYAVSQSLHYNIAIPDGSTHIQAPLESSDLQGRLPLAHEKPLFYVLVYALIGLTSVAVSVMTVSTQYLGSLRASRLLFNRLLETVIRATMRWYDVTPTGRVLNRFSRDIETIDMNLARSLQTVNDCLTTFFSSTIIIVIVLPPFMIPAFAIAFCYYRLAVGYLNTSRDLKRMESTSRSPLFSEFSELLNGVVTVRAFSAESRFLTGFFNKVDLTQRMWYFFWMINRWLMIRLDMLSAIAIFITVIFSLSVDSSDSADWAGWAALSITSAMAFTNNIYWTCRNWTQLELDLNSVERVVEYLDLPQEPPAVIENSRPPAHWPSSTGPNADSLLVVDELEVRYAPDLPAVLHDVSFSLKARERIGLLGRTGSGKSTLAMSILRFVDPAKGKIMIDGIDISTIGIHDLRSRLTFIPQDATLFSGTLRDNLDPFGDYSDIECLDALHRVNLMSDSSHNSQRSSRQVSRAPSVHEREDTESTAVASSSKTPSETTISATSSITELDRDGASSKGQPKITLETDVSAGGLNFSAGQRQLIAMARALLRQSAVIVLDEATSSIDFETDAKIQKAIREEFQGSLLLTIAHRLRTVIDYDRLIVLDAGRIVEFDTPHNLIQKEGGILRDMCMKSGSFAELEAVAKAKASVA